VLLLRNSVSYSRICAEKGTLNSNQPTNQPTVMYESFQYRFMGVKYDILALYYDVENCVGTSQFRTVSQT